MVFQREITLSTSGHGHLRDLTAQVEKIVKESEISVGIVNVFNVGSTAAIGTIEFEPGLCEDLGATLDGVYPPRKEYRHEQAWHDGNAHAHLQATMIGAGLSAPVRDGRLVLGTWQQIFLLECDIRSRKRAIIVTVYGE